MKRTFTKIISYSILLLFSLSSSAASEIKITVITKVRHVLGLGYAVKGKQIGGLGNSYSGKGPSAEKYVFGYRKHLSFNSDVSCGAHVLTKDSTVTLVVDGEKCQSIVTN